MGNLPSTFADIRALMVAESSWAKELFFENSQDIGAVRKSETITKYQAFNDLTLHAPFSSAVRHNVFSTRCLGRFHPVCQSVTHYEQSVHPICWPAEKVLSE